MDAQQQMQEQLQGADIAKVLREQGPIVKCVVLRATSNNNDDKDKKSAANDTVNNHDLVEEMELDTTPKKNECETILGGPFTFVGQYEEEGIMLMAKRGWIDPDDDDEEDHNDKPPQHLLNPHKLQPPFDATKIYGDILVIKVAEVADPLDDDEGETTIKTAVPPTASNDEFFLDYTKEQYLAFAARTDVVAPALPPPPVDNEEEEEDEEEEEEDEECEGESDDEEDEESAKAAMMELLLTNVLKQFRERNGRGPSTEELLVLKKTIAEKLFMELPDEEPPAEANEEEAEDTKASKRENEAKEDDADEPKKKKIKFGEETTKDDEDPKAILAQ